MKIFRRSLTFVLLLCIVAAFGLWQTEAHAEWVVATFTKVDNSKYPSTGSETPGQISYYYNTPQATLIIRGNGKMPVFDKDHPAPWKTYSNLCRRVIVEEGITSISSEAFKDFKMLSSVVFPSTLKSIASNAFSGCEKLKKVEVVIEIEDAKTLIRDSQSPELQAAELVKVTKEAVAKEVKELTEYWVDRTAKKAEDNFTVVYDLAGRPITIVERQTDGTVIYTEISYLNPATAVNEAKNRATVERTDAIAVTPAGLLLEEELEQNKLGQHILEGEFILDANGRQLAGVERDLSGHERTLDEAVYSAVDGSGIKNWTEVGQYGGATKYIELVDQNDNILAVNSVTYDSHGVERSKSETKNSYNTAGNKTASTTTSTQKTPDGKEYTSNSNTKYTYNNYNQLTGITQEVESKNPYGSYTQKTDTSYVYDQFGNLKTETVTNKGTDSNSSRVTEYSYDAVGKKTAEKTTTKSTSKSEYGETRTIETTSTASYDANERVSKESYVQKEKVGTEEKTYTGETVYTYSAEHVVSTSVSNYTDGAGKHTVTESYDADGRVIKRTSVDEKDNKKSTEASVYTYNEDGKQTESKTEYTDPNGHKSTYSTQLKYNDDGRVVERKTVSKYTDEETKKEITTNDVYSYTYDTEGRVTKQTNQWTSSDGIKHGSTSTYTYKADGSYTEVRVPTATGGSAVTETNEYDKNGKITGGKRTYTDEYGTSTTDITYDANNRVTKETSVYTGKDGYYSKEVREYSYKADGSRTSETRIYDKDGKLIDTRSEAYAVPMMAAAAGDVQTEEEDEVQASQTTNKEDDAEADEGKGEQPQQRKLSVNLLGLKTANSDEAELLKELDQEKNEENKEDNQVEDEEDEEDEEGEGETGNVQRTEQNNAVEKPADANLVTLNQENSGKQISLVRSANFDEAAILNSLRQQDKPAELTTLSTTPNVENTDGNTTQTLDSQKPTVQELNSNNGQKTENQTADVQMNGTQNVNLQADIPQNLNPQQPVLQNVEKPVEDLIPTSDIQKPTVQEPNSNDVQDLNPQQPVVQNIENAVNPTVPVVNAADIQKTDNDTPTETEKKDEVPADNGSENNTGNQSQNPENPGSQENNNNPPVSLTESNGTEITANSQVGNPDEKKTVSTDNSGNGSENKNTTPNNQPQETEEERQLRLKKEAAAAAADQTAGNTGEKDAATKDPAPATVTKEQTTDNTADTNKNPAPVLEQKEDKPAADASAGKSADDTTPDQTNNDNLEPTDETEPDAA